MAVFETRSRIPNGVWHLLQLLADAGEGGVRNPMAGDLTKRFIRRHDLATCTHTRVDHGCAGGWRWRITDEGRRFLAAQAEGA